MTIIVFAGQGIIRSVIIIRRKVAQMTHKRPIWSHCLWSMYSGQVFGPEMFARTIIVFLTRNSIPGRTNERVALKIWPSDWLIICTSQSECLRFQCSLNLLCKFGYRIGPSCSVTDPVLLQGRSEELFTASDYQ